jgi:hypothetical protein
MQRNSGRANLTSEKTIEKELKFCHFTMLQLFGDG